MNTPQAFIVSVAIIAGAILVQEKSSTKELDSKSDGIGRYMIFHTDAIIRVNVIDTQTGAVRHCWTEDYKEHTAGCSRWVGVK